MPEPIETWMPPTPEWAQSLGISEEAVDLYRQSEVIDLHVDTFIWWRIFRYDLHHRHGLGPLGGRFLSQVDLPRALEGGLKGATWIITTNPFRPAPLRRTTLERNLQDLARLLQEDDRVTLVRNAAEYRAARARGQHGAFMGLQGGNALASPDDFDLVADGRILRITLVHLTNSGLGRTSAPSLPGLGPAGLTPLGRDYVRRMNELKIFVDLAHIDRRAFFEAVEAHDPSQPLLVTHTGVDAVHPCWRNVTDAQLRAIADTGGTVGVMLEKRFLGKGQVTAETVVDHIAHIIDTIGEDHVSIGTDYDGAITPPADLRTPHALPRLVQAMLSRGFGPDRIRKVLGENFLRVVATLRG